MISPSPSLSPHEEVFIPPSPSLSPHEEVFISPSPSLSPHEEVLVGELDGHQSAHGLPDVHRVGVPRVEQRVRGEARGVGVVGEQPLGYGQDLKVRGDSEGVR